MRSVGGRWHVLATHVTDAEPSWFAPFGAVAHRQVLRTATRMAAGRVNPAHFDWVAL